MNSVRNKFVITLLVSVLVIAITVSATAVIGGKKPSVQSGSFENLIADRIELTLENTEFKLVRSSQATDTYTLTMLLSAKKTQADFYAVLNSFSITGIENDSLVFTALNSVTENNAIEELMLTATNGEPDTFHWQIDLTLKMAGKGTFSPKINIEYTSGLTKESATSKLLEIPLTITAE